MTSVTTIQKLHALPYAKIYGMLEYKLAMHGITLAKQTEEYYHDHYTPDNSFLQLDFYHSKNLQISKTEPTKKSNTFLVSAH